MKPSNQPSSAGRTPSVVHTIADLRRCVADARRQGRKVGLVPTMGALHPGHASLVTASAAECGFTIVTIFVNPTQFAPSEDFSKYPRTLDADVRIVGEYGADLVFAPSVDEVYPPGAATFVEMQGVALPLEGTFRPTHFRGVATVVLKLFNMAGADVAYFGRKDYQQTLVVKQLVRDFNVPIEIRVCPTVREADGLAMSSRNVYLSTEERRRALVISRALRKVEASAAAGERRISALRTTLEAVLAEEPEVRRQYAVVVDANTLAECETLNRPCVALVAAHVGSTRLIDNVVLNGECGMGIGE